MLTTDRAAGGVLVLIGAVALWESRQFPLGSLARPGPAYVPVVLGLLLVLFGVLLAARGAPSRALAGVGWHEWRHAAAIFAACAFVAWGLERLGYRLTMAAILIVLVGALERKSLLVTALMAGAIAWGSFFLFDTVLRVPLPRGPFGL
jgi:putative tricarboxylic transport membrane protein